MELFQRAKAVRLKSRHKYLLADEDELHVIQDRNGASPNARWTVEPVGGGGFRLRSLYNHYLTASNESFLLGVTGRKVLQTAPVRLDSSVEWEPVRDGVQVRLKNRHGRYLRANGGVPPWRNSVTHDLPHHAATQDWVLWDVEVIQVLTPRPNAQPSPPAPATKPASTYVQPPHPAPSEVLEPSPASHPSPSPDPRLSKLESSASLSAPLHKVEDRVIYFHVADDYGNVDEAMERHSLTFNGSSLEKLTHILGEETGLSDIILCSRNPLSGKLHPLRLQLPPNNATMHVVIVQASSRVARTFPWPYGS